MPQDSSKFLRFLYASWQNNEAPIGVAWLLYDSQNRLLVWSRGSLTTLANPAEAEAMALLISIQHFSTLNSMISHVLDGFKTGCG